MSETTNLNSELLSADARGKKHIPLAVFAVILIHIALFLFLLIAAGCRAKARARRNALPSQEIFAQQREMPAPPSAVTNAVSPAAVPTAAEPPPEKRPAQAPLRKAAQKISPSPGQRPTAAIGIKARIYTVKAGDTMEKIAKMHRTSVEAIKSENKLKDHLLRPGQQLRVGTQTSKRSNEV